jgi:hypothetical protein
MAVSTSVQHALNQFLNKAQNIYSVSVDSASRAPGESLSNYTVHFREPLQRVKSVQLGSITLPEAARYPFPQGGVMPLAEPLDVPLNAGLTIQENTKLVRGGVTLGSYTTHTTAWLAPTLNKVVATPDSGSAGTVRLELEAPHHLAEVARFYPPQLQARCVGTAFPTLSTHANPVQYYYSRITDAARAYMQPLDAPPLPSAPVAIGLRQGVYQVNVTPETLGAGSPKSVEFLPGYLEGIAPASSGTPDGSWFYNAASGATSYLHTTQPTLSELLLILNAQLVELGGASGVPEGVVLGGASVPTARLVTRVEISVDDAGAALVMRARPVTRTLLYNGEVTQATTTAMLVPTPLTGTILGDMFCSAVRPVILSNAMEARFLLSALWQLRTPATRPGAYAPAAAAAMLSSRLSPLTLPLGDAATGFQVLLPSGAAFPVEPPPGRYTGQQLAAQLSLLLQPASVAVAYVPAESPLAGTARFRFSHTGGLPFGLNFEAAPNHAAALGFDAACYSGGSDYTSQRDIVCVPSGGEGQYTRHNYSVTADASASRFSVRCAPPLGWVAVGTTDNDYTWAMTTTSKDAAGAAAAASTTYVPLVGGRYKAGDVLVVQSANSFVSGSLQLPRLSTFTVVVNAPWSGGSDTPDVRLERTVSLGVLPVPSPATPLLVAAEARTAFQLPFCVQGAVARQCGFSPQLYPVLPGLGQTPVAGAEFGGPPGSTTAVYVQSPGAAGGAPGNTPCAYGAPFNWNLLAPRYILMRLKAQAQMSCRNTHVYKTDAYPIFTKLIMLDSTNFYTMRDDLSNYTFTDFARVERVEVAFTYGDGSPVDFNGVDHSITLLFNTVQGSVDEISI